MAIRSARKLRPAAALLIVAATVVCAPALASAAPHSEPSTETLQKQLGQLALKNTQLVEKYDAAQVQLQKAVASAAIAKAKAAEGVAGYEAVRGEFVQVVQAQYEGTSLGAAGALLQSRSDSDYLDRVNSLSMVSSHVAQVVARVAAVRRSSEADSRAAQKLLAEAKQRRDALARQHTTVSAQIEKYRSMLSTLSSDQRVDFQRALNPSVTVSSLHLTHAGTPAAQKAVEYALDQVGKPYVFGAAGPAAFDCSGLTMMAWQAAGVSLPHSAADQYNYGTHVARADLEPGDLLFFYRPIGHVTIYAGDGMMVSAPTEGENVSVVPLSAFDSDYVGATRPS